jgi:Fe-S-cluster-containing dehydrogenase component
MTYAKLIDTKKCIGCKACQVICKEWNGLEGETTQLPAEELGLTNPPRLSAQTYMLLTPVSTPCSSSSSACTATSRRARRRVR